MKPLIRLITTPIIRLLFRIPRSRQLSRPPVFTDGGKTLPALLKELR